MIFSAPFLCLNAAVSVGEKVTVYPFIYERVNRYKEYNRYMLLTFRRLYGKIKTFRNLCLRSQNRLDTPV